MATSGSMKIDYDVKFVWNENIIGVDGNKLSIGFLRYFTSGKIKESYDDIFNFEQFIFKNASQFTYIKFIIPKKKNTVQIMLRPKTFETMDKIVTNFEIYAKAIGFEIYPIHLHPHFEGDIIPCIILNYIGSTDYESLKEKRFSESRKNKWGNLEDPEYNLVFDADTKCIIGVQMSDGKLRHLSRIEKHAWEACKYTYIPFDESQIKKIPHNLTVAKVLEGFDKNSSFRREKTHCEGIDNLAIENGFIPCFDFAIDITGFGLDTMVKSITRKELFSYFEKKYIDESMKKQLVCFPLDSQERINKVIEFTLQRDDIWVIPFSNK